MDIINRAKEVIDAEIKGIIELKEKLNDDFINIVNGIYECKGRLIVTGIGKSAHIARKIAATLSSIGTPSFFIHPAEASHGDLGMITKDDVILALSNSGESTELNDIISFAKRFGISLYAFVNNKESTLGKNANITFEIPKAKEACPLGLAPTTSTTINLVLGDALGLCLLDMKHFSKEQYRNIHPGGKLGKKLLKVSDIMTKSEGLPLVFIDTPMDETIIIMTRKNIGAVGVIDKEGNLIGIITDGDLKRHMTNDILNKKVGDIMTANPRTLGKDILASDAVNFLNTNKITNAFVVEDFKPVGFLHIHDCLKAGIA
ncbi:MAG: Arabinose 5-phosphate isomerase KdsD [Alphaproteobacteria bacterium ADurb.Bin438]|nr:MAG: Arabinose 5-phosphate isomerase KdsD [Alphaproteobacteria bacterium ADurb.Bin438]